MQLHWVMMTCLASLLAFDVSAAPRTFVRKRPMITSFNLDPVDVRNRNFRLSARDADLQQLTELLDKGASIDSRSGRGITALMYSARRCHPEVARKLLRAGADATLRDKKGRTALIHAASGSCLPVVELLLDPSLRKGRPNVQAKDKSGRTALDHARESALLDYGGEPSRIVRMLRVRSNSR